MFSPVTCETGFMKPSPMKLVAPCDIALGDFLNSIFSVAFRF